MVRSRIPQTSDRVLRLTFGLIAATVATLVGYVLSREEAHMISFMADDAFYYLVPAYAFAHGEGWTLDHVTRTSGFQLLYGYAAAVVSLATGYSRTLPMAMCVSSAAALLMGTWAILKRGASLYGAAVAAAAVAVTLASPRGLFQITAGLEWGWAVFATALVVVAASPLGLGATAFLAVLTRVDLALFVAIYSIAVGWTARHNGASMNRSLTLVAAGALGAAAAIAVTGINSWAITGHWIPNSVAVKAFWSRTNDFQPAISWQTMLAGTGPGLVLTWLRESLGLRSALVIAAFFVTALGVCASEWRQGAERFALAAASTVTIAAYTTAYARGVNLIGDHYSGAVIVPVALLSCGLFAMSRRFWPVVAGALGSSALLISIGMPAPANAAHLVIARHAKPLFDALPSSSRVAGWNVGIASWKAGGRVMNLDGLANADVVPAVEAGALACYLSRARVTHLMDYGFMFPGELDADFSKDEGARRQQHLERNGYDASRLYRCLTIAAAAPDPAFASSTYRVFAVDHRCVANLCPLR
jgi:hypothetical protein